MLKEVSPPAPKRVVFKDRPKKKPKRPPPLITINTVRHLLLLGYRPILIEMVVRGCTPKEIQKFLLESEGLIVGPKTLGRALRQIAGGDDLSKIAINGMKQEFAELHKKAREWLEQFQFDYMRARKRGDLKAMQFYADQFQSWWDRVGKFHFAVQDAIKINQNFTVVRDILEEVKNEPELARRLTKRLDTQLESLSEAGPGQP